MSLLLLFLLLSSILRSQSLAFNHARGILALFGIATMLAIVSCGGTTAGTPLTSLMYPISKTDTPEGSTIADIAPTIVLQDATAEHTASPTLPTSSAGLLVPEATGYTFRSVSVCSLGMRRSRYCKWYKGESCAHKKCQGLYLPPEIVIIISMYPVSLVWTRAKGTYYEYQYSYLYL